MLYCFPQIRPFHPSALDIIYKICYSILNYKSFLMFNLPKFDRERWEQFKKFLTKNWSCIFPLNFPIGWENRPFLQNQLYFLLCWPTSLAQIQSLLMSKYFLIFMYLERDRYMSRRFLFLRLSNSNKSIVNFINSYAFLELRKYMQYKI